MKEEKTLQDTMVSAIMSDLARKSVESKKAKGTLGAHIAYMNQKRLEKKKLDSSNG